MKRVVSLVAGVVGAAGLALGCGPIAAQSATDTTPPTLNAPIKASFVVGSQIEPGVVPDCGDPAHTADLRLWVPETFSWRGSDDSGAVSYDLYEMNPNDEYYVLEGSASRTYSGSLGSNTSQDCGGGNWTIYQWQLTARDGAGNETTKNVYGGRVRLTQDDNRADDQGYAAQPAITYNGSWASASCGCWSAGGVHRTTAKGASASIKVTLPYSYNGFPGDAVADNVTHVGLVMHKGPGRGKFKVYVNGVLKGTVDTYAATNQPRTVVWQGAVTGTSTVKIVNVATSGRPRIDLDAVLTN